MLSAFQNFSEQKERLETQKMVLVNQVGVRCAVVHVQQLMVRLLGAVSPVKCS